MRCAKGRMVRFMAVSAAVCTLLGASEARAQTTTAFFDDFDGGFTTYSGVGAFRSGAGSEESVQGYAGLGGPMIENQFGGEFFRNDTPGFTQPFTQFLLTNLPTHTHISIDGKLAVIDSWDQHPPFGPDAFNVEVDGVLKVSEFSSSLLAGAAGNVGFGGANDGHTDFSADNFFGPLHNIAHTSSILSLRFWASGGPTHGGTATAGWEGGLNESWAVDNLRVTMLGAPPAPPPSAVPEPISLALFLPGLAVVGLARRRRSLGK